MPTKLGLKVQYGKFVVTHREVPDLAEAKRRWMAGEDPFESEKKARKTKMEKRRIRKRYERLREQE